MRQYYENHNLHGTPEYHTWKSMKKRCYNKNSKDYPLYGARGIIVCERWLHSFKNFYKDMGPKPESLYSIERKDVNGNYEPSNCYWATPLQQAANKRIYKNNQTGFKGVGWDKSKKMFRARKQNNKKSVLIGYYKSAKEAAKAYNNYIQNETIY